jgi:hypothetical protein
MSDEILAGPVHPPALRAPALGGDSTRLLA